VCEDRRLEKRDKFRCGIGVSSLGEVLNSVDKVIAESDRFEGGPFISRIIRRRGTSPFRR
jgi:hypothetical protein